tara:strand:+ start:4800 stop:5849 length:1050 start_codon:yes stop_codon:yes gene_type:complete
MRKIIHVDMDAFYASVEMRDFPQYKNIPLAVGGTAARSVLCTCNYIARQYGVRSAMSTKRALQLCPNLTIVNGRMSVYKTVSEKIRSIFLQYTDIVEPLSLDEAFLDVTDSVECGGSATLIAKKIRQQIFDELELTASAGVAPNKFLAKIASDENKPNGQFVISPNDIASFVEQLPLKKIPGIGPKTAEKLKINGFKTCQDIRESNVSQLQLIVGKFAKALYQRSFGEDNRLLEVGRQRKSLAIETTVAEDLNNEDECLAVVMQLFPQLLERLKKSNQQKVVRQGIKLKFADFNQTTVEQQSLSCNQEIFIKLLSKAIKRSNNRKVRLVGLTLGFANNEGVTKQLDLFS